MTSLELVIDPRDRPVGNGTVRRLLPFRKRRMVGPFVFADVIGPEQLGPGQGTDVDAHPHIGLATVTYLLEGRMVHRDSTGAVQTIEPGAVNWMTAGSGVTHTERSVPEDRDRAVTLAGLQLWVALPDEAEDAAPSFEHAAVSDVPVLDFGASSARLAAGEGWGTVAPVSGASPLLLADVSLVQGSPVRVESPHEELGVLAISGEVRVDGYELAEGQLAVVPRNETSLTGHGKAMVMGGDQVGPRHIWWNFVHSDLDRIEEAKAAWRAQDFPRVPGDHEPHVPLPAS